MYALPVYGMLQVALVPAAADVLCLSACSAPGQAPSVRLYLQAPVQVSVHILKEIEVNCAHIPTYDNGNVRTIMHRMAAKPTG